ncbi:protein kilB [Streptomyces sp. IBSBF 2435]|uniref:protein kilB n=1 Tax=Streptomyces sp. IBSBF 2435 TaxID=2903531 RepID=UPI002FDBB2E6
MGDTIVAVAGTLLGGLLTALLQSRHSRETRRDERAERRAADLRAALGALVAAIGDHRRAMWHREHLRLTGAPQADCDSARAASRTTRSAVTAPLVAVSILEPDLATAARTAALAAFDMRGAADLGALTTQRQFAVTATDDLVAAAGRALSQGD